MTTHLPHPSPVRRAVCTAAAFSLFALAGWPLWSARAQTITYAGAVDPGFTPPAGLGGNLDPGFDPAGIIQATALQSDGKLLVVGSQIRGVTRLNADGSADSTFSVGVGTGGEAVSAVVVQPDNSILIGGEFTSVSGTATPYLTRLMPDGTIDTTYQPQLDGAVRAMTMLSSGMVAVGGEFATVNGMPAKSLARLDSAGNADPTFSSTGTDGTVYSIAEQPDGSGRLLVGGSFNNIGGTQSANLGQVMANGTADPTFSPGTVAATGLKGTDGTVQVVKFLNDGSGRALAGGSFSNVGAVAQPALVQVLPTGAADPTFRPGGMSASAQIRRAQSSAAPNAIGGNSPTVYSLDIQSNGKVVIGGNFSNIAGAIANSMARLNTDGSMDTQFNAGSGANSDVRSVLIQTDGKPVVAGSFTQINNTSLGGVGRLTADDGTAAFFNGQEVVADGFYCLVFPNGNIFGYFNPAGDGYSFPYFFHADLGFEYFIDAKDSQGGAYLYDFASSDFFYTSPTFAFPYLYDFNLNSVVYYYPDPNNPGHYNTDGYRFFYVFNTGQTIVK